MRAALLFGDEDLRVMEVADPVAGPGEVVVSIEAATTCGTDVKSWRRGHPLLGPYPAPLGHEMAGVRDDTGERVLVGDSVACGSCRACRAGRPQICREPRWIFGGFAERIAAPEAALHAVPDGLEPAAAAMAEPLAAAVHAIDRAPAKQVAARWGRCSPRCSWPRAARSRSPTATRNAAPRPRRRAR
jgi:L-iditol 2-dehydrogenase